MTGKKDFEARLWKSIRSDMTVMVGMVGVAPRPMTAQFDSDCKAIYFFTAKDTEIAEETRRAKNATLVYRSRRRCSNRALAVTSTIAAPTAASAVGRMYWVMSRRTVCSSVGTSRRNGGSRQISTRPANGRFTSPPRRRTGPESIWSTASSSETVQAGKACATGLRPIKAASLPAAVRRPVRPVSFYSQVSPRVKACILRVNFLKMARGGLLHGVAFVHEERNDCARQESQRGDRGDRRRQAEEIGD